uniref:Putative secreted protein n=1 Tax=Anopheles darlingi TaxID=43151 RepID=A0A2M4D955_ANODA
MEANMVLFLRLLCFLIGQKARQTACCLPNPIEILATCISPLSTPSISTGTNLQRARSSLSSRFSLISPFILPSSIQSTPTPCEPNKWMSFTKISPPSITKAMKSGATTGSYTTKLFFMCVYECPFFSFLIQLQQKSTNTNFGPGFSD